MASLKEMLEAAQTEIDAFDDEAEAMLAELLPTGNVWQHKDRRPKGAAVYAIWEPNESRPVWVGQTTDLFRRIRQHTDQGRYNPRIHVLTIYRTKPDEAHLRDLESVATEALKPTLAKQQPFRRGISPRLRGFIESMGL